MCLQEANNLDNDFKNLSYAMITLSIVFTTIFVFVSYNLIKEWL